MVIWDKDIDVNDTQFDIPFSIQNNDDNLSALSLTQRVAQKILDKYYQKGDYHTFDVDSITAAFITQEGIPEQQLRDILQQLNDAGIIELKNIEGGEFTDAFTLSSPEALEFALNNSQAIQQEAQETTPQQDTLLQNTQGNTQNTATLQDFKNAVMQNKNSYGMSRIFEVRQALNWPRTVFDNMLNNLQEAGVITLRAGDRATLSIQQIKDNFIDKHGIPRGLIQWENDTNINPDDFTIQFDNEQVTLQGQTQETTQQQQQVQPSSEQGQEQSQAQTGNNQDTLFGVVKLGTHGNGMPILQSIPEGWKPVWHASHPRNFIIISNGKSLFHGGERRTALVPATKEHLRAVAEVEYKTNIEMLQKDAQSHPNPKIREIAKLNLEEAKRLYDDRREKQQEIEAQKQQGQDVSQTQQTQTQEATQQETIQPKEQKQFSPEYEFLQDEDAYSPERQDNNAVLDDIPEQHIPDNVQEIIKANTAWPKGTSSADTQSIVQFFATADESSGFHELGHHIFRVLTDAALADNASDILLDDVDTIFRLAGVDKNDFYNDIGAARKTAHEFFSQSLEQYLHNGVAPAKELQGTFDRIKAWLVDIYHDIVQAFGFKLNPEMQEIFDRLLATPEQLAEQKSFDEINSLFDASQQEIQRLQQEIQQTENNIADNSQLWEQTTEQAYIKGKNTGEDYGIKEGREYQKHIEKQKAIEREKRKLARLKENFKLLQQRQRERRRITEKARKLRKSIKRMAHSSSVIWSRQQEIKHILDMYDLNKLGKLSYLDIQQLHSQIKELYDTGRRELAEKKLLQDERIKAAREQIRQIMSTLPQPDNSGAVRSQKDLSKQYKGIKGFGQKIIDWTTAKTLSAQRFFDFLDNDSGHVWRKLFVDDANQAYDNELRHKFSRLLAMEKTMADLGITPEMLAQTRNVDVPHEGSRAWTVDELLSVYAGLKNPKSREAILYGNFRNAGEQAEAWAAKCIQALTDNERALADAVIQEYEQNFDRINNALIDIYNQGMEHEENYTPMRRLEYSSSNRNMIDPDSAENLLSSQSGSGMGTVERGFSKKRRNFAKQHQNGIQLGLMSIWHSQVEAQEHAAAFGQYVRDLRRILLGRDENSPSTIRQLVKQVYGKYAWENIRQYFNIIANDDIQNAYDVLRDVSQYMAKNMSIAYLCGNLGTVLKQTNSFFRVLPYAGPVNMINSIGQFLQNPKQFLDECYSLDPQLKNRKGDPFIRALQETDNGLYQQILKWGMAPIGWSDRATAAISFKAVYDANIKHGLSSEQAIKEAQRAVLLTQPVTHIEDKPLIWQQHGYAKLLMMFTNDMAQTFGITLYDLTKAIQRGEIPKALATMLGLTLAAMSIKAISSGLPDEPDDPEEWAKWIAAAFLEQEINSIPLVGKEALTLWDARKGYLNGQSAFIAPFAKLMMGAKGLWDDKNDNNDKAVFNLIEGGSLLAPFPATALRRLWFMGKNAGKGEVLNAVKEMLGVHYQDKKLKKAGNFR